MAKQNDVEIYVTCNIDYGTRLVMTPEDAMLFTRIMDRSRSVRDCYASDEEGFAMFYVSESPRISMKVEATHVFPNPEAYEAYKMAEAKRKETMTQQEGEM